MKKSRIIFLCLMMLVCVLLLCSCGGKQTSASTTAPNASTRPGQNDDDLIDDNKWDGVKDHWGDDNTIRLQLSRYDDAELMSGAKKYMQGPDGPSSDKVQNLVYTRNLEATTVLGLNVEYYYIDSGWQTSRNVKSSGP